MTNAKTISTWIAILGAAGATSGCARDAAEPNTAADCREGPEDDVKMGLKTAGQAVEAGAETGVAGVKQFGKGVGGFVKDGSEGAKEGWNEGETETRSEAKEGDEEVRAEATLPPCP